MWCWSYLSDEMLTYTSCNRALRVRHAFGMPLDQQQERLGVGKLSRATDRVPVAERRPLLDEADSSILAAGGSRVGGLVSRADDHTNFLNAGGEHFLDENPQRSFGDAVAVHQGLQGKVPLTLASGGDDGFLDFHSFRAFRSCARRQQRCKMTNLSQPCALVLL